MAQRKVVQKTSFLGGEAGPLLEGRSDLAQFQLGKDRGQNFITLKGGSDTRRPGTRYVKNTLNDKNARLIPFVISYDSADNIFVVEISQASATNLGVRVIRVSDSEVFTPTMNTDDGLTIDTDSTIDLNEIQFAQSAEFLFITHQSFPAYIIRKYVAVPFGTAQADCAYATTAALPAVTYDNGASGVGATLTANANGVLTVDGSTPALNDRILVKNQVLPNHNGIYQLSTVGTASVPFVLTRTTDYDVVAEVLQYTSTSITGGTENDDTTWVMTLATPSTMGTDNIGFTRTIGFTVQQYTDYVTSSRALQFGVPYRSVNVSGITLASSATSPGNTTMTASAEFFRTEHIGARFNIDSNSDGSYEGFITITGITSPTVATAIINVALTSTSATSAWRESAWSEYRGWPRTVTFYGQRLVFGGNTNEPDTFWMSQVGDYFQMSAATSGIDDPLTFTLASTKLNQIRWMVGGKKLTIGTTTSEWVGTVTNDGTNLFVQFDEETTHGSLSVQPFKSGYAIPFVQRGGRSIREMAFNFDNDAYEATDLTLFGSHVGWPYGRFAESEDVRLTQLFYQESPFNVLWALDSFGRLYGLTRDKQQQIASWHSHVVGGYITDAVLTSGDGDDYPAIIKSICAVPDGNGRLDRLWMVVQREIDGALAYHVEYMDDIKTHPNLSVGSASDVKVFLDCCTVATAASTVTWGGYTRFANEDAYVVAEDANGTIVHAGELAVSGAGVITLPVAATTVAVGLHADAVQRMLPVEGGEAPEIKMNSEKGMDSVAIRMHETWGLRIGKNRIVRQSGNEVNTAFEPIPFDNTSLPTIETFTGTKVIPVPCDEGTDVSFALAMQEPWPCTILSLSMRVTNNEV